MPVATALFGTTNASLMQWIGGYGGFIVGVVALTFLQAKEYTK
jgi:hypothetical protein